MDNWESRGINVNKCKRCNVQILDDTEICPLCGNVVTKEGEEQFDAYPDIRNKIKLLKKLVVVAIYLLVVTEAGLCLIDYYTDYWIGWSVVTGICILYTIFTLVYSVNQKNGHIRKIFMQFAAALVFMLVADAVTGAMGWSVVYGLPCAVLLLDIILVACMLINFANWQSYLLVQLFAVLVSLVLLILFLTGVTVKPVLPWTSFGVSALIFSFCLSIGSRKAKNELKRRFYI